MTDDEPPREVVEVVITADEIRVEVHRLGEDLDERDVASLSEWGHANLNEHDDRLS